MTSLDTRYGPNEELPDAAIVQTVSSTRTKVLETVGQIADIGQTTVEAGSYGTGRAVHAGIKGIQALYRGLMGKRHN